MTAVPSPWRIGRPGLLRGRRRGYALVIVTVIMAAVALVSAAVLAVSIGEMNVSETSSREIQARSATEGVLDLAAWQIKENLRRIPGNLLLPNAADTLTPDATIDSGLDLREADLQKTLRDESQPWVGQVGFETTRGSGRVLIAAERLDLEGGGIDELTTLTNIAGPSDQRLLEFLDDTSFVQRRLDYDYHPGSDEQEVNLFAHGEVTKGQGDIRTATMRKSFRQTLSYYGQRERTLDDFSLLTERVPGIESPHDLSLAALPMLYPDNMDRSWDVSYPLDPAHPGRKIKRIGLLFNDPDIGLEDPGDQIVVQNWEAGRYQPPFWTLVGPTPAGADYLVEDAGVDTTTMRIRMLTDGLSGTGTPAQQVGFTLSGIKYYFDEETLPAYFETPHPYGGIELGLNATFAQTIWSPFNLTEDEAGGLVQPGGGSGIPPVVDPSVFTDPNGQDPSQIIQAMRLEFAPDSFLAPGDQLRVINANNGQLLATYTGAFPMAVTPFATRVRANTPLGIQLKLETNGVSDPNAYGYLVQAIEYVDGTGQLVREELPTQRTAHYGNLGSVESIHTTLPWDTTIFQPVPPGGVPLTSWRVHFNRATSLDGLSSDDGDYILVTLLAAGGPITIPIQYVSSTGQYALLIGTPGTEDIIALANNTLTLSNLVYGVSIRPFFDDEGAYSESLLNYGFWVDSISYTANNANDIDFTPASLATMQGYERTAAYTPWGDTPNERGEWWVTVPGATEIGIHFRRDEFRIAPGDALDIFDAAGTLIASLDIGDMGANNGGVIIDDTPGGGGGVVGELLADPNLPAEYEAQFGWILVPGDTAQIILRGDGGTNNGFNGFLIDRVAYFDNSFLANSQRELEQADSDNFNRRSTGPSTGFGEVRN